MCLFPLQYDTQFDALLNKSRNKKVTTVSGVDEVTHWLAVRLPPSITTVPDEGVVTGGPLFVGAIVDDHRRSPTTISMKIALSWVD